jgi:predicted ATPase
MRPARAGRSLLLLEQERYRFLEPVRRYAAERLDEAGEAAATRERHLACFLALAEQAEPALVGPEQEVWLARLVAEHDNLRAAMAWAAERGMGEPGLQLVAALWRFWSIRGYLSEGRGWLEAALAGA